MVKRILVCGGRDYQDRERVYSTLDRVGGVTESDPLGRRPLTIIHGGAKGADWHADSWAVHNWVPVEIFRADWTAHGKAAGPIRNQRMLDDGKPDLVIAFPGGRGTEDMKKRARKAGIEVFEVPHDL